MKLLQDPVRSVRLLQPLLLSLAYADLRVQVRVAVDQRLTVAWWVVNARLMGRGEKSSESGGCQVPVRDGSMHACPTKTATKHEAVEPRTIAIIAMFLIAELYRP
jgi:hypothetical protein